MHVVMACVIGGKAVKPTKPKPKQNISVDGITRNIMDNKRQTIYLYFIAAF